MKITDPCGLSWGSIWQRTMHCWASWARHIKTFILHRKTDRLDHIQEMVAAYKADGVIHYGLQFCQPYLMEAIPVEKALEEKNIPCLRIETDYSMEDVGQLKTRVEAFVEQLR